MTVRSRRFGPSQRQFSTPWGWAAAGSLFGAALTTLVFAPARWLAQGLEHFSGARVQLLQPEGTVWQGSAQLVLGAGSKSLERAALPGRVHWTMHAKREGLQVALQAACCLRQDWVWTLTPRFSGVQLSLSDLPVAQPSAWPSELLGGLGTPWNTLQLQGTLLLSTQQLLLQWQSGAWVITGRAQLDATGMSTSLSTIKPIGSYRIALQGGYSPTLELSTLDGSLQLSGAGRWVGGRLNFVGEASAAPNRTDALANLLNIIGRRDGTRSIIKVG